MSNKVTVKQLIKECDLEIIAGKAGVDKDIKEDEITSPGMELAGFYSFFEPQRVVIIGSKEATYLQEIGESLAYERAEIIFKQNPPAIIFSRNVTIPKFLIELGDKYAVPVLKSNLRTTPLNSKVYGLLREQLAERISVHGVLLDINGMGTLIIGKSGIGKSETALELVKRGHQLIADDRVEVYEREVGMLIGKAPETIAQYLEVRGVGILNVVDLFGAGAYRENKKIRLVIELEKWEGNKEYDRLGLADLKVSYFHTELPKVVIPILPGRNTAVLIEAAALNTKLKYLGHNGSLDLVKKIGKITRGEHNDE